MGEPPGDPHERVLHQVLGQRVVAGQQEGQTERLVQLGATRHPRIPEPDDDFIVLADPEGNLFCVIDKSG